MNKRFTFRSGIVPLFLYITASFFLLASCALRQDVDLLRNGVTLLEKRIDGIESKISGLNAETIAGKFEEKIADIRKNQAAFSSDIENLSSDIAGIEGRLSDRKISEVDNKKITGEISMLKIEIHNLALKIDELKSGKEKNGDVLEKVKKKENPVKVKEVSSEEIQSTYEDSYREYLNGNYKTSLDKFENFLKKYPQSEYIPNAMYWIGECYYSEGKYKEAISEFGKLIKKYPDSGKAPAAYLKIGYSFLKNNDKKSALNALKVTVDKFPGTKEAENAGKMIKENKWKE